MADETARPGRSDEIRPLPELRASHEDRDRVVELLQIAAGDGRLTAEELDERLEAALTARTHSELAVLTADLPATTGAGMISRPVPEAKDLVRIDCRSGSAKRDGAWVVPQRMQVKVTSGHVKLDFTQAVITSSALHIDAEVRSGGITLVTKPGIAVDTDDVAIRSGDVRVRTPWAANLPVTLRITVAGTVGSGRIQARPPRRTFWQWLLRQPRRYQAAIE
jgi:hypothetical protein